MITEERDMQEKVLTNSLVLENVVRLSPKERQKAVTELLKTMTLREIGRRVGKNHSTVSGWQTLRYLKENGGRLSLTTIATKLRDYEPKTEMDFMTLKSIKDIVTEKLKK